MRKLQITLSTFSLQVVEGFNDNVKRLGPGVSYRESTLLWGKGKRFGGRSPAAN